MRVLPSDMSHTPMFLLASDVGEVQLFCAKDFKAQSNAVSLSIQAITDIQFAQSCRFMLVAYNTGQVNMHLLDNSFTFSYIAQVQGDFTSGVFQKVCMFQLDGCDYACMLGNGPNSVNIKKLYPERNAVEVFREFNAACNVYDFKMHRSGDYLILLTELGRIYLYK